MRRTPGARALLPRLATALLALALGSAASGAELPCPAPCDTTVSVSLAAPRGPISPEIYGQYLEHVQQTDECIYPSLWDAASPKADAAGLRTDVLDAVRELQVPVVRWPGGCYADVYHWEDGIGPGDSRPVRPNEHWGGTESNRFGTDEFLRWCRLGGVAPYINVNLGSGTLEEALRWLEYCNGAPGTPQGRKRAANGHHEPWNVRWWGIGNETWGSWERGHMNADAYARRLREWTSAMRRQDPSIRILAVGSDEGNDPEWDETVLRHAGSLIDALTLHTYAISTASTGTSEFEAVAFTPVYMESRLRKMLATIDRAAEDNESTSSAPHREPVRVAVDEWNIRHHRGGRFVRRDPRTLQDAVFVSGMLNSMIRLSPRIALANYVFLVNGNGTLLADRDHVVRTPLFFVFRQYRQWMTGEALQVRVEGPGRVPPPPLTAYPGRRIPADYHPGEVPWVDSAAARQGDGTLALALVNRHPEKGARVLLSLPKGYALSRAWQLAAPDLHAANDFASPARIVPTEPEVAPDQKTWTCPPHSVVLLLCRPGAGSFR